MPAEKPPEPIPGQMDVYECIALAESEPAHNTPTAPSGQVTAREAVRHKLNQRKDQDD